MSRSLLFLFPLLFIIFSIVAQAAVPASKTFTFVNEGDYGDYEDEYNSNYRLLGDLQAPNFAVCFYNTTPSAYTLGIRMGSRPEDSTFNIMKWVWAANPGNPVGENATLKFGTNGNLVLAHANGKVAWQTGTANKGVVGLEIISTGNLVLVDNRGRFVWQSFSYPTDSLLVRAGNRADLDRIGHRVSNKDGSKGRYSLVLEKERLALYLKSKNSPKPILYYTTGNFEGSTINSVVLGSAREEDEEIYTLSFNFFLDNNTSPASNTLARPKYNSTLSFIRVESDGNIRMYTYNDRVIFGSWETTYILFNREGRRSLSECKWPTRCGSLGVCQNDQCVGCPTPKGLTWFNNETCAAPKLPAYKKGALIQSSYYKVVGVGHFTSDYTEGEGPVKVSECRSKCNADCGCLGFFYRKESSKCLLAYELGTLTKVSSQSHVAYIKIAKS
ncbi:hypothetical protein ACHQM5_030750 [Ranunculus cassubicifolius]